MVSRNFALSLNARAARMCAVYYGPVTELDYIQLSTGFLENTSIGKFDMEADHGTMKKARLIID